MHELLEPEVEGCVLINLALVIGARVALEGVGIMAGGNCWYVVKILNGFVFELPKPLLRRVALENFNPVVTTAVDVHRNYCPKD
jgi:hypothetical protein